MLSSTLLGLFPFVSLGIAGYVVQDDYSPENFFDKFGFFTNDDPTNGFVDYVSHDAANASSLIDTSDGTIYLGVDHTNKAPKGRQSVRLFSYESYNEGLFILDLNHFPGGTCGTWPAFWMVGPKWPTDGEIDILEGANSQVANQMTLHTGTGCEISDSTAMSGSILETNCDAKASEDNSGCGVSDGKAQSFSGLNENKGGVFATEIDPTSNVINVWFFARDSIPEDIGSGSPEPTSWGRPTAIFKGGCEISSHFKDLQIVFNTDFCGDWAGNTWGTDEKCSALADSCDDYVANNPEAFKDAYWSINSLKVYKTGEDAPASSSAPVSTSEPTTSSVPVSTPAPVSTTTPTSSAAGILPSIGLSLSLGLPSIPLIPEGTSTAASAATSAITTSTSDAVVVSTPAAVSTPEVSTPAAPTAPVNTPSAPAVTTPVPVQTPSTPAAQASSTDAAAPVAASSTSTGTHVFASGVPLPYASTATAPTIGATNAPAAGAASSAAAVSSPAGSSAAASSAAAVSSPAGSSAAASAPAASAPAVSSPAVSSPAAAAASPSATAPQQANANADASPAILSPATTTTDIVMETDVVQSVSTQIITITATGPAPAATAPIVDAAAALAGVVGLDVKVDVGAKQAVKAEDVEQESESATAATTATPAPAPSAWFKAGQRGEPVTGEKASEKKMLERAVRGVRGGRGVGLVRRR
ncbi:glycoside hydrolase family 16 protein [Aplosporella prunicola CBS 121167]|uniref:endo-1,3(4)-beta-glucanase n=1 Tax=Aplosporella prunicola CBS 121167 TaxID=1176127 RepID=A0A6A6BS92_9PEZI|nr:glycoside hydrolase family 16 protein [Aplosporella prunicola CBS 121167]KAF2146946.1 glycoside hydrolase family 16 protein [Aplosporella prunicola CBS 121167]